MDRAGRKALLYTSSMLMILSSLSLTMYSHANGCPPPPAPPNVTHLPQHGLDSLGVAPAGLSLVPLFLVIIFIFGEFITRASVSLGPSTGNKEPETDPG